MYPAWHARLCCGEGRVHPVSVPPADRLWSLGPGGDAWAGHTDQNWVWTTLTSGGGNPPPPATLAAATSRHHRGRRDTVPARRQRFSIISDGLPTKLPDH